MRKVVTGWLGKAAKTAGLGALLGLSVAAEGQAQSGASFINDKMIAETAAFDPDSWAPGVAEDLPNHGERVTLAAQNRGVLLYASRDIAIYNRANRRVTTAKRGPQGKPGMALEAPVCWVAEFGDLTGGGRSPVRVPAMELTIAVNVPTDFQVTSAWVWDTIRPIVRKQIATQFCGGVPAFVRFDLWIAGLQHAKDGRVFNIDAVNYPAFRVGGKLRQTHVVRDPANGDEYFVAPFAAAFVDGYFYFWDKVPASDQARLQALGHANAKGFHYPETAPSRPETGSYREVFNVYLGYGRAQYSSTGKLVDIQPRRTSLSYEEFLWSLSMSVKRTARIKEEERKAREALKAFMSGLANLAAQTYCSGMDLPWYMRHSWTVVNRQTHQVCRDLRKL